MPGRQRAAALGLDRGGGGGQAALESRARRCRTASVRRSRRRAARTRRPRRPGTARGAARPGPRRWPRPGRLDAVPPAVASRDQRVDVAGHQVVVVREQRRRVRGPHQQVGGVAAGREQGGQPLGRGTLVAEHPQVPVRRPECVAAAAGSRADRRRGQARRRTSRAWPAAACAGWRRGGTRPTSAPRGGAARRPGRAYPSASSRCRAASVVSRTSVPGRAATASSSGR